MPSNKDFTRQQETISKRFQTKELASVEIYGRFGKLFCRMKNLSQTGAFLEIISTHFIPKQQDLVRLTINLRQLNKIHVINAEVVWCKGLGMGIYFLDSETLQQKLVKKPMSAVS